MKILKYVSEVLYFDVVPVVCNQAIVEHMNILTVLNSVFRDLNGTTFCIHYDLSSAKFDRAEILIPSTILKALHKNFVENVSQIKPLKWGFANTWTYIRNCS